VERGIALVVRGRTYYDSIAVFLKSLTLKGFKSFADTTVLEMEPGVTVVVGPNGSGKSNVVDAIAWVLGAQAPSAVRSQKMEDVIFNGTSKRPALGRAEVMLTLDNSAGLLPLDFNEITISRTLFRNGDSEYAINGVECRLLDVQELLSDAGVGRQQHVIISQGQIDAVLTARAEDRRAIIEEAAGVLKYRKRKEKAERRLDSTEANLTRVQDLIREVRRQLRPLERQADAARRHGEIVTELRALKLFLAGREIAALRARLTALAAERSEAGSKENEIRTQLAQLDTAVLSAEAELSARGDSGLSDELVRVEQLRERARGLGAVIAERRRSMERDQGQMMADDVVAAMEADAAQLKTELENVERALAQAIPESEELAAEEAAFAAERVDESSLFAESSTSAFTEAAEVRGELRTLRNAIEQSNGEIQRLTTRLEQLAQDDQRVAADVVRMQEQLATAENELLDLRQQLSDAERRRSSAETAIDAAQADVVRADNDMARRVARVEAMREATTFEQGRQGAQHLADIDGVVGALIDLVSIDDGWEQAVVAAFDATLSAVVVRDADAGKRALVSLRDAGRIGGVLALGMSATSQVVPSGALSLREHVRVAPGAPQEVNAILDALISGVGCVDSIDSAITIAMNNPASTVVTRSGDRLGVSGWRIGVADERGSKEAQSEAQRLADLAIAESGQRRQLLETARGELSAARKTVEEIRQRIERQTVVVEEASQQLTGAVTNQRGLHTESQLSRDTITELRKRLDETQSRAVQLEQILPGLEEAEAAHVAAQNALGEERAAIEAKGTHLAMRRKDLDVRIGGLREREQFLRTRYDEAERRLAADAVARAEASDRRRRLEHALTALGRLAELVERHRTDTEARLEVLHDVRRRQSDEVRALAQHLDESRRARHNAEQELEQHRERARRVDVDEAEARMRLEAAVETLRRDLEVEPEVAEAAKLPEVADGSTPVDRARTLERDLRLMGPINPLALEEFNELQQRHEFLEEQLNDVRNTRRELAQVIKAVDQEIQSVFAAAFADVSVNFTELFSMLFPGGKGKLVLSNPEDMLNTGIEVEAQPPGKTFKKLSLLSGGERSLTALAYLFAVFRSRPSPFYVMDEVEAALDDVNLHRFLSLVGEFRRDAQLIIVSHQKRTMEAGDVLLGVSMQPGGSSKVVSERPSVVLATQESA
jgi:chromosome segregation protein